MGRNKWTRKEHIVAFNLYCKTPFSRVNSSKWSPKVSPYYWSISGAIAMKLANFARLDRALQKKGIKGGCLKGKLIRRE